MRRSAADLEPFRVPAYRRYLLAGTLTSVSLWTFTTSLNWTVLGDTGSAAIVGLISTLMTLPLPFAAVPGGMLTDRLGPRDLMALALLVEAVCVASTGVLAAAGLLAVPFVLFMSLVFGAADGLQAIPGQVLVGRIVPPRAMASAIGLSMLTIGMGRILGGTLGGALVANLGPQGAMVPAAAGVLLSALTIRSLPRVEGSGGGARLRRDELAEGLRWFRGTGGMRALMLLGLVSALFMWPYLGLLAVVVRDLLQGTPQDLGLLTASGGVGAILAAVTMGPLGRRIGRGRQLVLVMLIAGGVEVCLGVSHLLVPTLLAGTLMAMMTVTHTATANLIIQSVAPVRMRGRALAIYNFVFFGGLPIGYLVSGILADRIGIGPLLIALGILTTSCTALVTLADRRLWRLDVSREPGTDAAQEAGAPDAAPLLEPVPAASVAAPVDPT
ncbi:MAG: MFS transporter [Chloroflexota bacterium]